MEEKRTLPNVAIIMDGNGRWATKRGRPRFWGHQAGARVAMQVVEWALKRKIPSILLWGFSTENWKRSEYEVSALLGLFERFGVREAGRLDKANILTTFAGRREGLPERLQRLMAQIEERTEGNTGLHLIPAINFSATQEYADAANRLNARAEAITDESMLAEIYAKRPKPDLVIRTGGEHRPSDFLVGHAEFLVIPELWPDFKEEHFEAALAWYAGRERRFGGVAPAQQSAV